MSEDRSTPKGQSGQLPRTDGIPKVPGASEAWQAGRDVKVYDPAMCCPTGICGPSVDPVLPRFAALLDELSRQGHVVSRFNLTQQPEVFVNTPAVRALLEEEGDGCLPLILVDDRIVSKSAYPDRDELFTLLD